ncbi:putative transcriptional regulator [Escherichia coli]|nr:putative transcriptional regulator [Escherichia coli]
MQREDVLGEALKLLELQGIANTTLEMVAERVGLSTGRATPASGQTKRQSSTMRCVILANR